MKDRLNRVVYVGLTAGVLFSLTAIGISMHNTFVIRSLRSQVDKKISSTSIVLPTEDFKSQSTSDFESNEDKTPIFLDDIILSGGRISKIYRVPKTPTYSYKSYVIEVPQGWVLKSDTGGISGEQNIYIGREDSLISIRQIALGGGVCSFSDTKFLPELFPDYTEEEYESLKKIEGYREVVFLGGKFRRYEFSDKDGYVEYHVCDNNGSPSEVDIYVNPPRIGIITAKFNKQFLESDLRDFDTILSQIKILD